MISLVIPLRKFMERVLAFCSMAQRKIKYRWSDAWLLASIISASKTSPAEIHQIIAAGDAINHAIFTSEEFESGLFRLTQGNWIEESSGGFKATKKLTSQNIGSFSKEELEQLLNADPWRPREPIPHPENNLRYPGFSRSAFEKACQKYHRDFRK